MNTELSGAWDFFTQLTKSGADVATTKLEQDTARINHETNLMLKEALGTGIDKRKPDMLPYVVGGITLGAVLLTVVIIKQ